MLAVGSRDTGVSVWWKRFEQPNIEKGSLKCPSPEATCSYVQASSILYGSRFSLVTGYKDGLTATPW